MKRSVEEVIYEFQDYLNKRNLSSRTLERYILELRRLTRFCFNNDILSINEFDTTFICLYNEYIHDLSLSSKSLSLCMTVLRGLMEFCFDCDYLFENPFNKMSVILKGVKKERNYLSESEVQNFLDSIPSDNLVHVRDKSIFELMYGAGLRVNELVNLNISDIDLDHNEVFVLYGKGNKQRIVPICGRAYEAMVYWLKVYRLKKREINTKALYISRSGKRLTRRVIERNFKEYLKEIDLSDKGYVPHSLRHSCASHLLSHGADIRYIQELLGHSSIETTIIYAKEDNVKLKKIHKMYHPRENELFEY